MGASFLFRFKIFIRPAMRKLLRFFLFYYNDTHYTIGTGGILKVGKMCALANTHFNLSSGNITIGDDTIFSNNVMVITGRHLFKDGRRASLQPNIERRYRGGGPEEVPENGYDITIGSGCWIAAGAIISGGVTIGDNVIIGANSVVTKDIPSYSFAAGIPAKILSDTRNMNVN
jgi:acetyltransferase-like isoleucine patch superfamily enzyme